AARYARYFQRSFGTKGHLFERRYHALPVEDDSYLLELVRYIHLNPVRAGLVAHAGEYEWSSHRTYMGVVVRHWVRAERVLHIFGRDESAARATYARFVHAGEGGGLSLLAGVVSVTDGRRVNAPPAVATTMHALRAWHGHRPGRPDRRNLSGGRLLAGTTRRARPRTGPRPHPSQNRGGGDGARTRIDDGDSTQ